MKSERLKNFPVVLIMISGFFYICDIFCSLYGPHITFAHSYSRILYYYKLNVKVKFHPTTSHKGPEVEYSVFNLGARWEWVVNARCYM